MRVSAFGVILQVVIAVIMPFFTSEAPDVAADGSPRYDKEPLTLAYVVTAVKWIGLVLIHGCAIVVALSIVLITPEQALDSGADHQEGAFVQMAKTFMIFSLVAFITLVLLSGKMVGLMVKFAIESVDQDLIGVQIQIKKVYISIWQAKVTFEDLVVKNPETTHEWETDAMLEMNTLIVDINLWRLLSSGTLEIDTFALLNLTANFERSMSHYSNVHHVLSVLNKNKKKQDEEEKEDPKKTKADDTAVETKKKDKKHMPIILHQLVVKDIDVHLVSSRSGTLFTLKAADINEPDYSGRTGKFSMGVSDIVMVVLKSILDTVVANVGFRACAQGARSVGRGLMDLEHSVQYSVCKICCGKQLKPGEKPPTCCGGGKKSKKELTNEPQEEEHMKRERTLGY